MYFVYIIYSKNLNKYYVGYTHDIFLRLSQHNSNVSFFSKTTSQAIDWAVVYKEKYQNKALAIKREKEIKRWKSRKAIEKLIHDAG